ncbi:hypothetical protein D3C80_990820 [compost metagenome]
MCASKHSPTVACAPSSGNPQSPIILKSLKTKQLAELTRRERETSPMLASEPVG